MQITYKKIIEQWVNEQPLEKQVVILFEKVRDIPYGNIGSRDPLDVYRENKGTCSGKHELLKGLYKELGLEIKDCIIMHRFKQLGVRFPDEIKKILDSADIVDPHNYFKVNINNNWLIVDVTWDKPLQKLGFPVNEDWDGKSNMQIAVATGGEVYEPEDTIEKKKEIISNFSQQAQEDRKLFLAKTTAWLDHLRETKEI